MAAVGLEQTAPIFEQIVGDKVFGAQMRDLASQIRSGIMRFVMMNWFNICHS
jgi:hypothetical protein